MDNLSWIVVADANSARIFATLQNRIVDEHHSDNALSLVQELNHHDSNKKMKELVSDKAGAIASGTFVSSSDPKEEAAAHFAQNIALYLEKNRNAHKYADLVVVAPPHFMGLLNQHFSKEVTKLIKIAIKKNYASTPEKELAKHLKAHL